MKRIDVGFIGLAGAGKDTAALALVEQGWKRVAFADKLKSLAFMFGWDGHKDSAGRKLLQDLGMAARTYNSDFWVNETYSGINAKYCVFTDVRFENEAQFIRDRGGIIVRIVRPDQISADQHESETNQFEIRSDYKVVNGGTIEDLRQSVLNILT